MVNNKPKIEDYSFHKNSVQITYNISGELITLYELKHIILRRNRIPPHKFFKLGCSSDPRIDFLEGTWDDYTFELKCKILCLCTEPNDLFDDKMNIIVTLFLILVTI